MKRRLLDQVRDVIRGKHYSYRTEKTYAQWIWRFILHHGKRHPAEMAEDPRSTGQSRPTARMRDEGMYRLVERATRWTHGGAVDGGRGGCAAADLVASVHAHVDIEGSADAAGVVIADEIEFLPAGTSP